LVQQACHSIGFRSRYLSTERSQAIVPAAVIVAFRALALSQFDNQSMLQEALYRTIESARAQPDFSIGAFSDILHDGVPVLVAKATMDRSKWTRACIHDPF
jgi:hypothetical protein